MTEQIDNLLTPRVMVTNEWPGGQAYEKGQVFTQMIEYGLIRWGRALPERPTMTRYFVEAEGLLGTDLAARFGANLRLLHWSEGRTKNDMRAVTHFRHEKGKVTVAKKWDFLKDGTFEGVYSADNFWYPVSTVTPATSAQYLEYLNQQSKG